MQSPAFRLPWGHLQLDPALRQTADGDVKGIRSAPSEEETPFEWRWGTGGFR